MTEIKLPDFKDIDLNKEVSFTCPEGFFETAAAFDFLPDDETRVNLLTGLSMSLIML